MQSELERTWYKAVTTIAVRRGSLRSVTQFCLSFSRKFRPQTHIPLSNGSTRHPDGALHAYPISRRTVFSDTDRKLKQAGATNLVKVTRLRTKTGVSRPSNPALHVLFVNTSAIPGRPFTRKTKIHFLQFIF